MPCDFDREKIATYLDGECDPAARGLVAGHLEGCGECRSLLEAFTENDAALKAADAAPVPAGYWESYESRLLARLRLADLKPPAPPRPFLPRVLVAAFAAAAVLAITVGLSIQTQRNVEFDRGEGGFEHTVVSGKGGPFHGKGGDFAGQGPAQTKGGPVQTRLGSGPIDATAAQTAVPPQTIDASGQILWGSNDVPAISSFVSIPGTTLVSYGTLLTGCQNVMVSTVNADPNNLAQVESLQADVCETGLLDQVCGEKPATLAPDVKSKLFQSQVLLTSIANCTWNATPDLGEFQVVRQSIVSNGLANWAVKATPPRPPEDAAAYQGAFDLLVKGQCAAASDAFSKFTEAHPQSPFVDKATYWRGFAHVEIGNYGKGKDILLLVPEKHPASRYADDALYKVGEVYERYMHDYDRAIATYQEVVKKYPDSCTAVQSLQRNAQICEQNNDYKGAMDNWSVSEQRAQEISFANRVQKKQSVANTLPDNYYSRVARSRLGFIQSHSDSDYAPLTLYTDAQNLALRGSTAAAIDTYRKVLAEYPGCSLAAHARIELAECLLRDGRENQADQILRELGTVNPPEELIGRYRELLLKVQERAAKQQEQQAK